ncbi:MAG: hypothetical protein R6V41_05030 [Desulfobacteraceae bacterium]
MTGDTQTEWYYIIVQNPGSPEEQLTGFSDEDSGTDFVPVFRSKEEAQQCFLLMPKDVINIKYEVQAIIKEDLIYQAGKKDYRIYLMDDKGAVKDRLF